MLKGLKRSFAVVLLLQFKKCSWEQKILVQTKNFPGKKKCSYTTRVKVKSEQLCETGGRKARENSKYCKNRSQGSCSNFSFPLSQNQFHKVPIPTRAKWQSVIFYSIL